ncbi:polysaccharide export protein [Nannocystis sp. ILAH1]|uniref:polysaccharide biosynthesis/export family protein n=1 Tax=unclassified Nannocystis TaxID=2627009 RepID=UPI002270BCA6|nr:MULTISPECIES: polysaccharide biosynthesis/export family protein [unclassified Nannocystis]MCY0986837.1 polysaccharide export protein [Nannocystis sp. ILAH1]MCY1071718.1 polysaccharide export protein [Nannocystis sp. RBIL2]
MSARPRSRLSWLGPGLGLVLAFGTACDRPARVEAPVIAPSAGLRPGDELDIRVFDEDRFNGTYAVAEDGTIDFPMVGGVAVTGLTKDEVARQIETRLADGYLNHPHVVVQIKERGNREISILGQVNEAGSLGWRDGLTLVQAVSLAGGLTPFAAPARVKLTRRTGRGDETVTFEISLSAIVDGRAEDLVLRPGDIVFVPETRM